MLTIHVNQVTFNRECEAVVFGVKLRLGGERASRYVVHDRSCGGGVGVREMDGHLEPPVEPNDDGQR